MPKLRDWERDGMLRDYAKGVPLSEIAARYEVSKSAPIMLAKSYGVIRGSYVDPAKMKTPVPECPVAEVRRLAAKGLSITRIGALLRCRYADVARVLAS
jgi:hypothetical protein